MLMAWCGDPTLRSPGEGKRAERESIRDRSLPLSSDKYLLSTCCVVGPGVGAREAEGGRRDRCLLRRVSVFLTSHFTDRSTSCARLCASPRPTAPSLQSRELNAGLPTSS